MATIKFGDQDVRTSGELPEVGTIAPDATLVTGDLASVNLHGFTGTRILNIFPSIGTGVCQNSVRAFSAQASALAQVTVLHISKDLPFAHSGFCGAEGLEGVTTLSTFRGSFGQDFGVEYLESPFEGLLSRCVVVLDGDNRVVYTEQVSDTGQEPDYASALAAAKG